MDGIPHMAFVLPDLRVITALIGNVPADVLDANLQALVQVSKLESEELPPLRGSKREAQREAQRGSKSLRIKISLRNQ